MTAPTLFLRQSRQPKEPPALNEEISSPIAALAKARLRVLGLPQSKDEAYTTLRVSDFSPRLSLPPQSLQGIWTTATPGGLSPLPPEEVSAAPWFQTMLRDAVTPESEDGAAMLALSTAPLQAYTLSASDQATDLVLRYPQESGLRHQTAASAIQVLQAPDGKKARLGLRSEVQGESQGLLANTVLYVHLAANAHLELWVSDPVGEDLQSLTRLVIYQEAGSQLQLHLGTLGNALARTSVKVELRGPGSHAEVLGTAAVSGHAQAHRHIWIRHLAPSSTSRQLFKTVAAEKGRASVDGTIEAAEGAKGTVAGQTLKSLLLGDEARSDSKPRLLIRNDDVKCNHGATSGQLDEEQRFYLRSRGLTDAQAVALLTQAFLRETLQYAPIGPHREGVESALKRLLPAAVPPSEAS